MRLGEQDYTTDGKPGSYVTRHSFLEYLERFSILYNINWCRREWMELTFPLEFVLGKENLHFSPQFYRYYLKNHSIICFNYRTRPRIFFLIKSEA